MNVHLCMKCPHRQQVCGGPCPCTVDGRDILDHAKSGDCPKGYFAEPEKMPPRAAATAPISAGETATAPDIPLAGDVVESIAKRIGADRLARLWEKWTGVPCGCAERREKLNAASARLLRWVGMGPSA